MNNETHSEFFDWILSQEFVPTPKVEYVHKKEYSDLELACFLNHKEGKMFLGHFIPNDHPLMLEAGITHNFNDLSGKRIPM